VPGSKEKWDVENKKRNCYVREESPSKVRPISAHEYAESLNENGDPTIRNTLAVLNKESHDLQTFVVRHWPNTRKYACVGVKQTINLLGGYTREGGMRDLAVTDIERYVTDFGACEVHDQPGQRPLKSLHE